MSDTVERVTRYVRLTPGVVELTGGPPAEVPPGEFAPAAGVKLLRPRGTYVFGSVFDGELRLGTAARLQVRELAVTGVYSSTLGDVREVAELVRSGCLDLLASVTHEFSLEEAPKAFETLRQRPAGMVRVVVTVTRKDGLEGSDL